jgi:hypothetical protein
VSDAKPLDTEAVTNQMIGGYLLCPLDRALATCRQRDELVEALRELVEALDMTVHDDGCGRTDECDDERGHDCGHHGRVCPSCVCGVGRWQAATTKARDVLAKWSGK